MINQPDFTTARWRKSSNSADGGCVEVAFVEGTIGVRDTKAGGAGPTLMFNEREWEAFVAGVGAGEFSLTRLAE